MEPTRERERPIIKQRKPALDGLEHFDGADFPRTHPLTKALEQALRAKLSGEVHFDDGSRALYATDGSNYRQVPIGVVIPRSTADVEATVAACRQFGVPVLSRGGGTSLAGQCCNVAVVIDFSKYLHGMLWLDPKRRLARVEPGLVLDDLRHQAEKHHLTFGPDPSTHNHCTLGGMIGNNSCGSHSMMAGRTADNIESLDILLYDGTRMRVGATSEEELARIIREGGRRGEIYGRLQALRDRYAQLIRARFPKIPRRVSGYPLEELLPENGFHLGRALAGTEGTCVTVLGADLKLVHSPPFRSLLVLGYPSVYEAADQVPSLTIEGVTALEGIDEVLVSDMKKKGLHPKDLKLLPEGAGWLMVELGGETRAEADGRARELMAKLKTRPGAPKMKLFDDKKEESLVWTIRESGLGATARVPNEPDTWEGWEDSAVAPERLGDYLRALQKLYEKFHYKGALYGHFGQGCVHTRIDFELTTAGGVKTFHDFLEEASSLVVSFGGSLSGEHGDGQSKAEFLTKMYGPELVRAFEEYKAIWDPDGKMNPGKIVHPYRATQNLRLGADFKPQHPKTHFQFPQDGGDLTRATLRCVGVGECRRESGGVMCPSYKVTREERHSTRGRAHLLFEMLEGEVIQDGWKSESVKEALDLCLACKGCKNDCPVNVDMATYKAEFLSHYYAGRLRPRAAYAMGLIPWWARMAQVAPGLVNTLAQAPGLGTLAKSVAGIAPQRALPRFASRTLRQRLAERPASGRHFEKRVLLWPDTFTNHFHPESGLAAVEVLERAGFQVALPKKGLCCGRPLYDYGMLDLAKHSLRRILDAMKDELRQGTAVVGLEPSCVAVFKDELPALFPKDEDARRLTKQTFMLSEFLVQHAPEMEWPRYPERAVVQGHCHQKSVLGMEAETKLFEKLGMDAEVLDSGCCGMAGSFGFEKDKFQLSIDCGEQALFPAVRKAKDALVVANGFSCRQQIQHGTGREAVHLSQVLERALHQGELLPRQRPKPLAPEPKRRRRTAKVAAGIAAVAGLGLWSWAQLRSA